MKIEVDMSNYFVCIIIEAANYMNVTQFFYMSLIRFYVVILC